MKIYVAHSSSFEFQKHLYAPLRASLLNKEHNLVLPHETEVVTNSKNEIISSTIVIAEVSRASIGVGIELGWADDAKIPIVCIYSEGTKPSPSLKSISAIFVQYSGAKDMIEKITTAITAVRSTM
jgi:hypothetical protein